MFQGVVPIDNFPQTSAFYNMEHERMFHIVLASIGIPFFVVAPATYTYEFIHHDGELFRVLFLEVGFMYFDRFHRFASVSS